MLIILFGYDFKSDAGISHKNPARTIWVIPYSRSHETISSDANCSRLKTFVGTENFLARSKTNALGLLLSTNSVFINGWSIKYLIIASALVPPPEAKMAIRNFWLMKIC